MRRQLQQKAKAYSTQYFQAVTYPNTMQLYAA